jgi:YHS domain-containing protein
MVARIACHNCKSFMPHHLFHALTLVLALVLPASADSPAFFARNGAAIDGYDTVAYFTAGQAVKGRQGIAVEWKGATWRFATQANREAFEADPRAYAPQYGGYCAYAVSRGHVAPTDPLAWKIVDGKLYLAYNPGVIGAWTQDLAVNLRLGDTYWPAALKN